MRRRLRGLLGLSFVTGVAWALVGGAIGVAVLLIDPAVVDAGEGPGWLAYYFGRAGLVAGAILGLLLSALERRAAIAQIRLSRVFVWGAIGGAILPYLTVAPHAMLPALSVLGAASACGALSLARRAERLELSASRLHEQLT